MKDYKDFENKFRFHASNVKFKGKSYKVKTLDEEMVSFKEIKKQKDHKHYRNYDNALRAKNLDLLLSYDEEE